jgi:hypothetical protein
MTDHAADRRAELIAGAASNDLSREEAAELSALRATDPSIDREITQLRAMIGELGALGEESWDDSAPPDALRDRVLAVDSVEAAPVRRISRGRGWLVASGMAACLAGGAVIGAGAMGIAAPGDEPRPGAPGVLGALESIDFSGEPGGARIDGSIVAHTWGTETILEVDGLPAGESYSVLLVGSDGSSVDSGSFLGSRVTIDCRMNAAIDRPVVETVEIRDATGSVVASASLPAVDQ